MMAKNDGKGFVYNYSYAYTIFCSKLQNDKKVICMENKRKRKCGSINFDPKKLKTSCETLSNIRNFENFEDYTTKKVKGIFGSIMKINLINFMCHSNLVVDFNSRVNFIIGRNGSGKSAILTAIMIALGAKASITNRASNFREFIKKGKTQSVVSITLNNSGIDAYAPNVYGSRITIIRHLQLDKAASYKILNFEGKKIPLKKEELDKLLEHLNIQIDNPITILNQDISRNFLHSKDSHKKYLFFMKATMMEKIKNEYNHILEEKLATDQLLREKKTVLKDLKMDVKQWEEKWRFHQSLEDLRLKMEHLKKELVWSHINCLQLECKEEEEKINRLLKDISDIRDKIEDQENKQNAAEEKKSKMEEELKSYADKAKHLVSLIKSEWDNLLTHRHKLKDEELKSRAIRKEYESLQQDHIQYQQKIDQSKHQLQDDVIKRQERIKEIEYLTSEEIRIQQFLQSEQSSLNELRNKINDCKEEEQASNSNINRLRLQLEQCSRILTNLKEQHGNKNLNIYAPWMPSLHKKIAQAYNSKRFLHCPRGPLGYYIRVKDNKWCLAIEQCLGKMLHSFCVNNIQDSKYLQQFIKECAGVQSNKIDIYCCRFQNEVYDVNNYKVQCSGKCVPLINVLEIVDPVITNVLCDQLSIENVMLVESNEIAREIMSDINKVPVNCRRAYTISGDIYYPDPNYRTYSCMHRKSQFLQVSVQDQINMKLEEKENLLLQISNMSTQLKALKQKLKDNLNEELKLKTNIENSQKELRKINIELLDLKNFIEPKLSDISSLEEELNEIEVRIQKRHLALKKQEQIVNSVNGTCYTIKEQHERLQQEHSIIINDKVEYLKLSLLESDSSLSKIKKTLQCLKQNLNQLLKQEIIAKENFESKKKILDNTLQRTLNNSNYCQKVETTRLPESIETELCNIQKRLEIVDKEQGTKLHVTEKYYEIKCKYQNLVLLIQKNDQLMKKFNAMLEYRQHSFEKIRSLSAVHVQMMFQRTLEQRKFRGQLKFDHDAESVDIEIDPRGGTEMNKDMRCLSGGERSFSTVCFILSLWEATCSPFRILDEFDVFMDVINRKISLELILQLCSMRQNYQCIFLTPQDISALSLTFEKKLVYIYKMPNPQSKCTEENIDDV